jgi:hypothetical protein
MLGPPKKHWRRTGHCAARLQTVHRSQNTAKAGEYAWFSRIRRTGERDVRPTSAALTTDLASAFRSAIERAGLN